MGVTSKLLMVIFQGGDLVNSDQFHLLVIFVGVIALFCLILLCVLAGAAIGAWKAYKSVSAEIVIVKQKAFPIVASIQGVIDDLRPKVTAITGSIQQIVADATPKVKTVTANVADMSDVARTKIRDFEGTFDKANETFRDASDKTRAQVDRVDGMVASALKATSDIGNTVHRGIRMPVMEVAGVVNGVKAAIDVLVGRTKHETGSVPPRQAPSRPFASTPGARPGPTPVPRSEARDTGFITNSDPSSAVAPSPGAAEVVERFRAAEKAK